MKRGSKTRCCLPCNFHGLPAAWCECFGIDHHALIIRSSSEAFNAREFHPPFSPHLLMSGEAFFHPGLPEEYRGKYENNINTT